ncbi:hypothetical protein D3C81_1813610 [compost metagenome]
MAFEEIHLLGKAFRVRKIVLVLPRDITTTCQPDAPVQCAGQSHVVLMKQANPRIAQRFQHLSRVVLRAIVDQDKLKVVARLSQDTVDGFLNVRRPIVDGQNHADKWCPHSRLQEFGIRSRVSWAAPLNQRSGATTIFSAWGLSHAAHQLNELLAMM